MSELRRIDIVETPSAIAPDRPSYEELLAALKEVLSRIDPDDPDDVVKAARALIARAESKS